MNDDKKAESLVCLVCGKRVKAEESSPYLNGVAHIGCKGRTEEEMREGSGTIFGHERPPV